MPVNKWDINYYPEISNSNAFINLQSEEWCKLTQQLVNNYSDKQRIDVINLSEPYNNYMLMANGYRVSIRNARICFMLIVEDILYYRLDNRKHVPGVDIILAEIIHNQPDNDEVEGDFISLWEYTVKLLDQDHEQVNMLADHVWRIIDSCIPIEDGLIPMNWDAYDNTVKLALYNIKNKTLDDLCLY